MVVATASPVPALPMGPVKPSSTAEDLWPSLAESNATGREHSPRAAPPAEEGDWEFVSPDATSNELTDKTSDAAEKSVVAVNPRVLNRCSSTPDFGNYDCVSDSSSSCSDENRTTQTESSHVIVNAPTVPQAVAEKPVQVRRIPSFKDAILLNAQETSKEQAAFAQKKKEMQEKILTQSSRRKYKPRLVVTPIKRCAKSTGDLKSLVRISEDIDENAGSGGGVGGYAGAICENSEVLGETDAMDFYHQKAKGSANRKNARKSRPDEAKRKEIIMYKKDLQRKKQQESQGGGKKR